MAKSEKLHLLDGNAYLAPLGGARASKCSKQCIAANAVWSYPGHVHVLEAGNEGGRGVRNTRLALQADWQEAAVDCQLSALCHFLQPVQGLKKGTTMHTADTLEQI